MVHLQLLRRAQLIAYPSSRYGALCSQQVNINYHDVASFILALAFRAHPERRG